MLPIRTPTACLAALLLAACAGTPIEPQSTPGVPFQLSSTAWEQDMQRFAAEDALAPPPREGVVFVGSSSIRLWDTLQRDFPGVAVVNRGFGGSEIRDSTWYADRIVIPLAPRQVVLYAGDNDLYGGRSPAQLRDDFRAFVHRLRHDLPRVGIAYISTKPSPARVHLLAAQRQANALIREEAIRLKVAYIDLFTPMLDATGQPRDELFLPDRLHMNPAGYELWRQTLTPYLAK